MVQHDESVGLAPGRSLSGMRGRTLLSAAALAALLVMLLLLIMAVPLRGTAERPVTVDEINRAFSPPAVQVVRGGSIAFFNADVFAHQIYVSAPNFAYESNLQPPGKTVAVRFGADGRFVVRCHIHPKMHLRVTVIAGQPAK